MKPRMKLCLSMKQGGQDEYLHEGGWQNFDNPLHELEFVRNEMHSFHLDQERLQHRQCTTCKEAWPTWQNVASEVYICYHCKRDKKSPKSLVLGMIWTKE